MNEEKKHEPRVMSSVHRHMALEVARGQQQVALVRINNGEITLERMSTREFDSEYYLEPPIGANGNEITPRRFARHFLGLKQFSIQGGAATTLVDIMALNTAEPRTNEVTVLASNDGHFIGAYESLEDAQLVRQFVPGAVIVRSKAHIASWSEGALQTLKAEVAPKLKAKSRNQLIEGVLRMAKSAAKPAAPAVKAVEKVKKQRVAKADGPVAKIKAYVESHAAAFKAGTLTRGQATEALKAMGVNKGTIGVQLGKWLKTLGIQAQRGPRKPKVKAKEERAAAAAKTKPAKASKANGEAKAEKKAKGEKKPKAIKATATATA